MIPEDFLAILVCPLGKAPLRQEEGALVCSRCGPRFTVTREGYPNMLIDEAELPKGCRRIEDLPCVKSDPGLRRSLS